jgi:hypothetical protein
VERLPTVIIKKFAGLSRSIILTPVTFPWLSRDPSGKTVDQTRDLWKVSEMSDEKITTCMSHKPCNTGIINNSESESDFDSDNEDDDS